MSFVEELNSCPKKNTGLINYEDQPVLMFREIIAVFSKKYTQPKNKMSCNNSEFFNIKQIKHTNTHTHTHTHTHFFWGGGRWRCDPTRVMASSFLRFLDHTQRRTTVGRTPLDEWSARRRNLYLTTHNTHNTQISMPPVGFEPTISAGERPQTYALDRAATGTGDWRLRIFPYLDS